MLGLDFELFHQSMEAENCYGPFQTDDLCEENRDLQLPWADDRRLIWEGYLNVDLERRRDMVLRAEFQVGERDVFGIGFSDNVVSHVQRYIRWIYKDGIEMFLYTGEEFRSKEMEEDLLVRTLMPYHDGGWRFKVEGIGFEGTLQIELDWVPEDGRPVALEPGPTTGGPVPV